MSKLIDTFSTCKQITEWIDPWDARLEKATGETAPNQGCTVRHGFWAPRSEWVTVKQEVQRIVLPELAGTALAPCVKGNEDWFSVRFVLPDIDFLASSFPVKEQTTFATNEGSTCWAAVALCGDSIGLGVFARELPQGSIALAVQPVMDEVFEALL